MSDQNGIAEVHRERWRRIRGDMSPLDSEANDFAEGGLSRLVKGCSVRMLILHGDPEANYVEFDDEFWKWWLSERKDPVTEGDTQWGSESRPTMAAAVRGFSFDNRIFSRLIGASSRWRSRDGAGD